MGFLTPLFNFLKCLVLWALGGLLSGLADLLELVLGAILALAILGLGLLPALDLPQVAVPEFVAWIAYFFPVGAWVAITLVVVAVLVAWHVIVPALRWLKAVA